MTTNRRHVGPLVKKLRKTLVKVGLSQVHIETVVRSFIGVPTFTLKRIPRVVTEKIKSSLLSSGDSIILILTKKNKIRMYSGDGFKTLVKNGHLQAARRWNKTVPA